jgi:hypothetical protein
MAFSQLLYHLYFPFEFSSHDLRCRSVDKNLGSIESCIDHGIVRDPCLLTNFISYRCVFVVNNEDSNGYSDLARELLDDLRQLKLTNLSFELPSRKAPCLIVHITIRRNGLDSDCDDFRLVDDDSGIVKCSFVQNGRSQLTHNIFCNSRLENVPDDIPRVVDCIVL